MSTSTEIRLRNLLSNVAQILDVVKFEWSAENAWSDWDQSVRDELSEILGRLNDERIRALSDTERQPSKAAAVTRPNRGTEA